LDSSRLPPHSTGPPPSSHASTRSPSLLPKSVPIAPSRSTAPAPPPSPLGPAAKSRAPPSAQNTPPAPGYCTQSQISLPPCPNPAPPQPPINSAPLYPGTNATPPTQLEGRSSSRS